jgi:hypothetical protein
MVVDEIERLREEAWIGDTVLALFVRAWLLGASNQEMSLAERAALFELFTSNQFLSTFGEPTRVEAEIGRIYQSGGILEAFSFIETKFLRRFLIAARRKGYDFGTRTPDP